MNPHAPRCIYSGEEKRSLHRIPRNHIALLNAPQIPATGGEFGRGARREAIPENRIPETDAAAEIRRALKQNWFPRAVPSLSEHDFATIGRNASSVEKAALGRG